MAQSTEYTNGLIDEVRIYNRALTAAEISMRYGSGLVGSGTSLKAVVPGPLICQVMLISAQ